MFSELERLRPPACGRPCDDHVIVAWLSRQLICSESVVFRILVERRGDYIVVSQQFAAIKKTFHGLVVKTGIDARGSRGRVYRRCRVYGRCWVYRRRVGDVRGSSGETLNPLERERFVWCRVLVTREFIDDTGVWPVTQEDRDLVPARPSTRWTWVESTVGSFGSSSTESPADVIDDRPPWRTRFEAYFCFYYSFIL